MRVVLIGSPVDRARLRSALSDSTMEVIGEAATMSEARAFEADAYLIAADDNAEEFAEPLTPREIEVLELVAEGLPNKAIAERLSISDQTVKFHVASICAKLGAANRTEAVRVAIRRGLVPL
jgi:DNA-binding CsgD family transcriptional regulator